jgi:uncharacterized protein
MKIILSAGIAGFIFAIGLGYSGMTQPQKVIGFLDIFGNWDPSLLFVMIGAIAVHSFSYRLIRKRANPVFSARWHVPEKTQITPSLVFGSIIFGIGWGLGGYCPGPALTSLASFQVRPALFVAGMIGGMLIFKYSRRINE